MKKLKICAVLAVMVLAMALFAGCATKLEQTQIAQIYSTAIQNTSAAPFYFWKENNLKQKTYKEVKLLSDIDDEGKPIQENGAYKNHRLHILEQKEGVTQNEIYAGFSKSANKGGASGNFLLQTKREGEAMKGYRYEKNIDEVIASESFAQYMPKNVLAELCLLTIDDMDFSIEDAKADKKTHLIKLSFGIKKQYLERYQKEQSRQSIFANAAMVSVEIAYNRISELVIYENKKYGAFDVKTEVYNFKIVYCGPKFDIPAWDKTVEVDGKKQEFYTAC